MRYFALLAAAALIAGSASAHQLSGPTTVLADASGHFAYEITLVVESVTELAWFEIDGSVNTDLGYIIADGFCLEPIEPGNYSVPIEGNLLDPASEGIVAYSHYLCDGWEAFLTTTILPAGVSGEASTWGSVKSLYR